MQRFAASLLQSHRTKHKLILGSCKEDMRMKGERKRERGMSEHSFVNELAREQALGRIFVPLDYIV